MNCLFPVCAISMLLAACGGFEGGGGGGQGGDAGSAGGDAVGSGAPRERGKIGISSRAFLAGAVAVERWELLISYGELYDGPNEPECFPEQFENCVVIDCSETPFVAPMYDEVSAGTLTITGGSQAVTVTPDGKYYGVNGSTTEQLYGPGDNVTAQLDGAGDIPAHSLTATAPMGVTVVQPEVEPPGQLQPIVVIDLAEDLQIEWTNGSTGKVSATVGSHDWYSERITNVTCTVDASDGAMTIPHELLSRLVPSDAETDAGIAIKVFDVAETTAGDCEVTLSVETQALSPEGYLMEGTATLLWTAP